MLGARPRIPCPIIFSRINRPRRPKFAVESDAQLQFWSRAAVSPPSFAGHVVSSQPRRGVPRSNPQSPSRRLAPPPLHSGAPHRAPPATSNSAARLANITASPTLRLSICLFFRRPRTTRPTGTHSDAHQYRMLTNSQFFQCSETGLTSRHFCGWTFFEQLFLAVDQRINIVRSQFKSVAMRDGVGLTRLHTVAAENTPRVIDVVHAGVTLAGGNPIRIGVFCGFNVDAVCRASRGTKKASHALFQAAFVAVQHMDTAIARLKMHRLVRIILRHRFAKHISERDTKTLRQRAEGLSNFSDNRRHAQKSNKRTHPPQIRAIRSLLVEIDYLSRRCESKSCSSVQPRQPPMPIPFGQSLNQPFEQAKPTHCPRT